MKTLKLLPLLALSGLLFFQACDDDLLDVTETFTFEHEFVIYDDEATAEQTAVVDLSEDESLISQYGSKIKDIEIQSVKYWLKAHNGSEEQQFNSVVLNVANTDGTDVQSMVAMENVLLHSLLNNPTDLSIGTPGILKLENLVENDPHAFMYIFEASLNEAPADFTIVFEVKAKMTANPLN